MEAVKPDLRCSWQDHSGRVGADVEMSAIRECGNSKLPAKQLRGMQQRRSEDRLGHFGQFVMFELRAKPQALHDTFTYMTNVLFSDFQIEVACAEWDSSAPTMDLEVHYCIFVHP